MGDPLHETLSLANGDTASAPEIALVLLFYKPLNLGLFECEVPVFGHDNPANLLLTIRCFVIIANPGNGTKDKLARTGIPEEP